MIIGKGLIATHLTAYDSAEIVFFASGVSNSQEVDAAAYLRETDLILKTIAENSEKIFVYFSTYSISDPSMTEKPYILHKIAVENIIKSQSKRFLIIRTSNLVGKTPNPNTIANYLSQKVRTGAHFECWNVQRNLLDIADLCAMTNLFLQENYFKNTPNTPTNNQQTIFLVCPIAYRVTEIVACLEGILKQKANCTVVEKGAYFDVDTHVSSHLFEKLNIRTHNYLEKILKKYIGDSD